MIPGRIGGMEPFLCKPRASGDDPFGITTLGNNHQ